MYHVSVQNYEPSASKTTSEFCHITRPPYSLIFLFCCRDTYGLLSGTSPKGLASWVSMSQGRSFAFEYLLHWGGRYAPSLNLGQAWRWFTSPFVHQNFQHVVANSVLLAAFSGKMQHSVQVFVLLSASCLLYGRFIFNLSLFATRKQ